MFACVRKKKSRLGFSKHALACGGGMLRVLRVLRVHVSKHHERYKMQTSGEKLCAWSVDHVVDGHLPEA